MDPWVEFIGLAVVIKFSSDLTHYLTMRFFFYSLKLSFNLYPFQVNGSGTALKTWNNLHSFFALEPLLGIYYFNDSLCVRTLCTSSVITMLRYGQNSMLKSMPFSSVIRVFILGYSHKQSADFLYFLFIFKLRISDCIISY